MIEWKKYNPADPPETDKEYLVYTMFGYCKVAVFEYWENEGYVWCETQEMTRLDVSDYAEINLPQGAE